MTVLIVLAFGVLAVTLISLLSTCLFVRHYSDPRDSSCTTTCSGTFALSTTLFCVLLIPVDIFIVSYDLQGDGTHGNMELVTHAGDIIHALYYCLYGAMIFCAFFLLPFAYFYFEEDDEDLSTSARACAAMKYTLGFVIVFAVLLVLGLVLKLNDGNASADWINDLTKDFSSVDGILYFSIGCVSIIGLCGWLTYTAYGLASVPLELLRARDQQAGCCKRRPDRRGMQELDKHIRIVEENQRFLAASYDEDESVARWSKQDRKKYNELKREERKLKENKYGVDDSGRGRGAGGQAGQYDCWGACWDLCAPFRLVLAIVAWALSLLIMVSLAMSTTDRLMHSQCGSSCAYALDSPTLFNPLDEVLKLLAPAFPLDFVFFGVLVLYVFLATVHGLVMLGVRLCVWKLYSFFPRRTMPNGVLMGCWMVMFVVLVLNMQVLTLSPSYVTFGTQFMVANSTAANATSTTNTSTSSLAAAVQMKCTLGASIHDTSINACTMTKVGLILNTFNVQLPFFAAVLFFANLGFLGLYLVFNIIALFRSKAKTGRADSFLFEDEF